MPATLFETARADATIAAAFRAERFEFGSRADALAQMVRLAVQSDAYLALLCYRISAHLRRRGTVVVPFVTNAAARLLAQVDIGSDVQVEPGIYLAHGQVTIRGPVEVGKGAIFYPWVRVTATDGPIVIGNNARIGTGARLEHAVTIGNNARVGANAWVEDDVAPGATVAGQPATVVGA